MHEAFRAMAAQHSAPEEVGVDAVEQNFAPDTQRSAVTGVAAARAALKGSTDTEASLTINEQARNLAIELKVTVAIRKDEQGNPKLIPLIPRAKKHKTAA
jgi:hypothetical protein